MDNLPLTPLANIEWGYVTVLRLVVVTLVCVLVIQFALMLSNYWHWLMPLRREIEAMKGPETIAAPPVVWTFAYHLTISLIVLVIGVAMGQSALRATAPTLATFTFPVLLSALGVILNQFQKYYARSLRAALHAASVAPPNGSHLHHGDLSRALVKREKE